MNDFLKQYQGMDTIIVINKTDLPKKIDLAKGKRLLEKGTIVTTSLLKMKV